MPKDGKDEEIQVMIKFIWKNPEILLVCSISELKMTDIVIGMRSILRHSSECVVLDD